MKWIKQLDETDCGAACLGMVANHYGSQYTISHIRELALTDRSGTNLKGLVGAGKALGFDAKASKGTKENLQPGLPVPLIVHWITDEGLDHFVVAYKISKDKVWIADPNRGKRALPMDEFAKHWSGYAVFLTPNDSFKLVDQNKGRLTRFLPLFKPHIKTMVFLVLTSFILTIFGVVSSFYFQYLVDQVLGAGAELTLHVLSIGLLILTLFAVLMSVVRSQFLLHFSMKTSITLSLSYIRHIFSLPIKFFETRKIGEILSRFEDGEKVRNFLASNAMSVVLDLGMMVFSGSYLLFLNSTLFFLSLVTVPLSTLVAWVFAKYFSENYRAQMAQKATNDSFLVEALNGMTTIKGLNAGSQAFNTYEKNLIKFQTLGKKAWDIGNIKEIITGLISGWGGNLLFWVGALLILKDQLTLGQLMSFTTLAAFFTGPLNRFINMQASFQETIVAADRLGEVLVVEPEVKENDRKIQPDHFTGRFVLCNVDFRYGARQLVLDKVSLEIEPGQQVAFVGASGCGKSTLVKLLIKMYSPTNGNIEVDGYNILDLDTNYLRSRVGFVPQEVFLFSGTVYENISLHKPDASLEEVVWASQKAQIHDFINNLPDRYDTILAEKGASLSGGERQRIALARALLGGPDVLILDEATSALDSVAERAFHNTLEDLSNQGITTILIAHRLSTITRSDKIFVMDKGRIVETGVHETLIHEGGIYSTLWQGQKI